MSRQLKTLFDSSVTATAEGARLTGGVLFGIEAHNPNTADVYLQLFDALVANITLGSTAPKLSFLIPAGRGAKSVGATEKTWLNGVQFATAISYAVTTTATGSTAPTTAIVLNMVYA